MQGKSVDERLLTYLGKVQDLLSTKIQALFSFSVPVV